MKLQTVAEMTMATRINIWLVTNKNHFIEIDTDEEGYNYLVIHSGSRGFGKQIADFYQDLAENEVIKQPKEKLNELIRQYKSNGRQSEIEGLIKEFNKNKPSVPAHLSYVEKESFRNYRNDMIIATDYANRNRISMAMTIIDNLDIPDIHSCVDEFAFSTVHNYIEFGVSESIIRKGAVQANKGTLLLIPMNMQFGSLICVGKGNEDWNNSAPHGAGRIMSRSKAKQTLNLDEFKNQMKNIYSTTICEGTLDEAPGAYKDPKEIIDAISETVSILKVIKPIYNFKSEEKRKGKDGKI